MDVYEHRVKNGAALLDRHHPGWERGIDLGRLELHSCPDCVLGQLFADPMDDPLDDQEAYVRGLDRLKVINDGLAIFYGFDLASSSKIEDGGESWVLLTDAWKRAIRERLEGGP